MKPPGFVASKKKNTKTKKQKTGAVCGAESDAHGGAGRVCSELRGDLVPLRQLRQARANREDGLQRLQCQREAPAGAGVLRGPPHQRPALPAQRTQSQ